MSPERKPQLVRGKVTPTDQQRITVHQIPKADRLQKSLAGSWWAEAPRDGFTSQASGLFEARYRQVPARQKPEPKPERPTITKRCAVCTKKFAVKPKGPHGLYCSPTCNKKAWKLRQRSA